MRTRESEVLAYEEVSYAMMPVVPATCETLWLRQATSLGRGRSVFPYLGFKERTMSTARLASPEVEDGGTADGSCDLFG